MITNLRQLAAAFAGLMLAVNLTYADQPAPPTPAPTAAVTTPATGPKIQFETPVYDFVKIRSGEAVKHTFIFTNTGTATLEIKSVRPGCGCTAAGEWTKKVEPGMTGNIPIQVNTANFPAGPIAKVVTVESNDGQQPSIVLQIKGAIWKPIEVTPNLAYMNVSADAPEAAKTTVKVTSNLEEPLTLSTPEISNKSFKAEVKTIKPGKEFQIELGMVPPVNPGAVQATVTLKTSSKEVPTITFTAYANVQPALMVNPPQITLPSGPLPAESRPFVTIENKGTKAVKVFAPAVVPENVGVQLTEPRSNTFTLTLTFPVGFDLKPGQTSELTVKTSHPQYPVIKVPIIQATRAVPTVSPIKSSAQLRLRNLSSKPGDPSVQSGRQAALLPPAPGARAASQ
jgi:hypothetical protein